MKTKFLTLQAVKVRTDYCKFSEGLRWLDDLQPLSALQGYSWTPEMFTKIFPTWLPWTPILFSLSHWNHFLAILSLASSFLPCSSYELDDISGDAGKIYRGLFCAPSFSVGLDPSLFPTHSHEMAGCSTSRLLLTAKSLTLCHLRAGRFCGCWGKIKAYLN